MTAATVQAIALARELADKALAAPNGIRKTFLDAEHDGADGAKREANRWRTRIYQARAGLRRTMYRMANPNDVISGIVAEKAADPDVVRTAYDPLTCDVDRAAEPPGWTLTVRRVTAADLGDFEIF